jgi:hypothetical protein
MPSEFDNWSGPLLHPNVVMLNAFVSSTRCQNLSISGKSTNSGLMLLPIISYFLSFNIKKSDFASRITYCQVIALKIWWKWCYNLIWILYLIKFACFTCLSVSKINTRV